MNINDGGAWCNSALTQSGLLAVTLALPCFFKRSCSIFLISRFLTSQLLHYMVAIVFFSKFYSVGNGVFPDCLSSMRKDGLGEVTLTRFMLEVAKSNPGND